MGRGKIKTLLIMFFVSMFWFVGLMVYVNTQSRLQTDAQTLIIREGRFAKINNLGPVKKDVVVVDKSQSNNDKHDSVIRRNTGRHSNDEDRRRIAEMVDLSGVVPQRSKIKSAVGVPDLMEQNPHLYRYPKTVLGEIFSDAVVPGQPGDGGLAYLLTDSVEMELARQTWAQNEFNLIVSDRIGLQRKVKDSRIEECRTIEYPSDLPTVSVVIIFHNEAWSTLLRTVNSVWNESPHNLIHQIILVDDYSEREYLKHPLEKYLSESYDGKAFVVHTEARQGLIRARIVGSDYATGDVIIFLDSHCECSSGWLEPLIYPMYLNPATVTVPMILSIGQSDFHMAGGGRGVGSTGTFNWNLLFIWRGTPSWDKANVTSDTQPIRTPTMAGGLFAIHRLWWEKLGRYDPGYDLWGAENLEISYKTWMCGGDMVIVPCSQVGHVFRGKHPYKNPTDGPDQAFTHNARRLAEVWLDDIHKLYYYKSSPDAKSVDHGDISERLALKQRLNCRSFQWYMDNVIKDMYVPDIYPGGDKELRNPLSKLCLDTLSEKNRPVGVYNCHGSGGNQHFSISRDGMLVQAGGMCLRGNHLSQGSHVRLGDCDSHSGESLRVWKHDRKVGSVVHKPTGLCLDIGVSPRGSSNPTLQNCNNSPAQVWVFGVYNETQYKQPGREL